jgi:pimeloyl-ACP methyl ester carboxylesterase
MPQVRANGIDIEYESFGRDGDPCVLLIMGFSAQLTLWQTSFCEQLAAKGFRVIRFDNRDVGKSQHFIEAGVPDIAALMVALQTGAPVTAPYTLDDMAADAAGLLDALGIKQAHIVGASMGGMIAQLVAINHPAKTKSLTSIMSTTARPGLPPGTPEAMGALMTPPASPGREDRIAASLNTWKVLGSPGFPATDAELRKNAERDADRVAYEPTGIARQMAAIVAAPPRHETLGAVKVPTLVLHGKDDPIIPYPCGEDTAKCVPGAELVIVPGMAHDFTELLTPVYLKHVGDFVGKVEGRA